MVDTSLLAHVDLFRILSPEAFQAAVADIQLRELSRGDVLFREDDDADELFVVEHGRIAIAKSNMEGRESVFALMERGDVFGELALFDGSGRSAAARALEPSSVYVLSYEPLRTILLQHPELLWGVVELFARRLRSVDAALADSVFLDVTGRTAKRLLELAGSADEFVLPLTQEELAGMVGASRERVNKTISSFVRLGWIEQRDRRYVILDREQLTRRAH